MNKVLIICGPTATGKTKFALEVAKKFAGELVSADSRQVFVGKNIIHGKDLPLGAMPITSHLIWRGRPLLYYEVEGIKIWLYDVVAPGEPFSIAYWHETANLVISDILSRNRLPIAVGGSGLYLKTLTHQLDRITTPPLPHVRRELSTKSPAEIFDYLSRLDPFKAASLNRSDRLNPHRLIRAVELALSQPASAPPPPRRYSLLTLGLSAPRAELYHRVNVRVVDRIAAGATAEDPALAADPSQWQVHEHHLVRRQLTWFNKQPNINWFDISTANWQSIAQSLIESWYNET